MAVSPERCAAGSTQTAQVPSELLPRLLFGVPLLALWGTTLTLAVRYPLQHWAAAGREKRFWTWAHVLALFAGPAAFVVSIAFLVAVWPRLRQTARDSSAVTSPALDAHNAAVAAGDGDAAAAGGSGVMALRRGHDGMGGLRRLTVEVDGELVARLKPGEIAEVTMPAGDHAVRARMDWLSSALTTVTVFPNSTVRVAVSMGDRAITTEGMLLKPEEAIDVGVVEAFSRW